MGATISGTKASAIPGPTDLVAGFRGCIGLVLAIGLVFSVFAATISLKTSSWEGPGTALSGFSADTPHELDTCDDSSVCSPFLLLVAAGKTGHFVPNDLQAIPREHSSQRFMSPKVDMPPPRKLG